MQNGNFDQSFSERVASALAALESAHVSVRARFESCQYVLVEVRVDEQSRYRTGKFYVYPQDETRDLENINRWIAGEAPRKVTLAEVRNLVRTTGKNGKAPHRLADLIRGNERKSGIDFRSAKPYLVFQVGAEEFCLFPNYENPEMMQLAIAGIISQGVMTSEEGNWGRSSEDIISEYALREVRSTMQ